MRRHARKSGRAVWWLAAVPATAVLVCGGCSGKGGGGEQAAAAGQAANKAGGTDIWCTAWPLYDLTRQLAPEGVTVGWLAPERGFDAALRKSWFPPDERLGELLGARLLVDNGPGAPYAAWSGMVSLPADRVCDATFDFRLRDYIPVPGMQITHSHGPEGEHSHDYMVPLVWHQPALAARQARTIAAALVKQWPESKEQIGARLAELLDQLQRLETEMETVGQRLAGRYRVVLASPDLLFLARGLGIEEPEYRVWNATEDIGIWRERLKELIPGGAEGSPVVVLMAGPVPPELRGESIESVCIVGVDMLESGEPEGSLSVRLRRILERLEQIAADPAG